MSKDKGIFEPQEGFANPPKSPFSVDDEGDSPFASSPPESKSPFSEADDDKPKSDSGSKADEPFASGGSKSPFGYEPPAASTPASPFSESKEVDKPAASSPFADASSTPTSPFSDPGFGSPKPAEEPKKSEPEPAAVADPVQAAAAAAASAMPAASTPASSFSSTPAVPAAADSEESDSSSIKQLELRAIFGVDRELTESEILKRAGALPGVRHLARVASADAGAVDALKRVVAGLGFGSGQVKLYCGSAPIEFVREGSVLLAVQTDGGFAPGVRETLMIVARELGKM